MKEMAAEMQVGLMEQDKQAPARKDSDVRIMTPQRMEQAHRDSVQHSLREQASQQLPPKSHWR